MTFLSIEQMSCWILDKIQEAESTEDLWKISAACSATAHFWLRVLKRNLSLPLPLRKHSLSVSAKVTSDQWCPAGSAWPPKSAWRMGDMSGMPLLALFDTTESVWLAGHVSHVSSSWNSHHSERMFSIPPAPYPLLLREKVKFGPSVTDQRAGPSSWWPSTAVKMFSSPSPIACLTFFAVFYSYRFVKPKCNHKNKGLNKKNRCLSLTKLKK